LTVRRRHRHRSGARAGRDAARRRLLRLYIPYSTVEAVLPLSAYELAFVDDTNFGSTGRHPNLPDSSDFIVLQVPGIRG
jgi:hypothetical protein